MIFKKFAVFILFLLFFSLPVNPAAAIADPLKTPNNKFGIHILDPNEVGEVAELVNSSGGDWGFVTVPLRDDDKDRVKWQKFFDTCGEKHLIPIIRLATVMTPNGWEEPNLLQSIDFANFLNQFSWPTKNRYIIVYNEPNHQTEWGGVIDPAGYARILQYTSLIFKQRSPDFYILPAGLDAACPNGYGCLSLDSFVGGMLASYPEVFNYIDAWNSHAYPNPGFSGSALDTHKASIVSYRREIQLIAKNLPVFITETGWEDTKIGQAKAAENLQTAFEKIWQDENLVAITPFLFNAQGTFAGFSFIDAAGAKKPSYQVFLSLNKEKGQPEMVQTRVLAAVEVAVDSSWTPPSKMQTNLPVAKWSRILNWIGM